MASGDEMMFEVSHEEMNRLILEVLVKQKQLQPFVQYGITVSLLQDPPVFRVYVRETNPAAHN